MLRGFLMSQGADFSYNQNIACACDEFMKAIAIIFGALGVGKWRV